MSSHHPFLSHLVALLSLYELGPTASPVPKYDGPRDWQTDAIERSLANLAQRMHTAEEQLSSIHATDKAGPESKKPRSSGELSLASSTMSSLGGSFVEDVGIMANSNDGKLELNGKAHRILGQDHLMVVETASSPTTISGCLDDLAPVLDTSVGSSATESKASLSAPTTSDECQEDHCPTCGRTAGPARVANGFVSPDGSRLVIPPGPLAAAASESGMSAVEELRLLKQQVSDVARVCKAVAMGDLSQKITVPVQGAVMDQLKDVINTMVDKLDLFAKEVTRISQEVGSEGILGGQAVVLDVDGIWRELTDVVNVLGANLTNQIRSIAAVTEAVARGDLSKQIEVEANGETLDLKTTVNGMVRQLRTLTAEVTRVTLEVGSQGKLGRMAEVPGVEGVWQGLTSNVNQLCSNATNQARSRL